MSMKILDRKVMTMDKLDRFLNEEKVSTNTDLSKKITYIVRNYEKLSNENKIELSLYIAEIGRDMATIGMREELVKLWMAHAFELDPNNNLAKKFLTQYNLKEKKSLLDQLSFSPLRESDNRTERKNKINQYKTMCQKFLSTVDEEIEQLEKDSDVFDSNESNIFKSLIHLLEKIVQEVVQFQTILEDYEESSSTTFYNKSFFEMIQKSIVQFKQYQSEWVSYFDVQEEKEEEKSALSELNEMIGLKNVKSRIETFYKYLKFQKERKLAGFQTKDEQSLNMILLGNPGTGKTTIARLLAKIYYELGVLPSSEVVETNRSQLVGSFVGQTEENVRSIVEKSIGSVLFIDEAYTLKREGQSSSDYGQTAIDTLLSLMSSNEYNGQFSVILAGYPEEMRQFLDSNPGLRSRFPASNIIELPNYTEDELLQIGELIARNNDFFITEDGKKELAYLIEQERVDSSFGNARTVQNIISQAIFNKGTRETNLPDFLNFAVLDKEDFQTEKKRFDDSKSPSEKLASLVGLQEVKEAVQTYISFIKMQNYRREHNFPNVPIQLHSVFTGNPGTGKTTVAKIYAELLKECGMLKRGHLVVAGRADLIAGYVGQSAIKTKKKIREALGGVLFIDEAYSLFRGNNSDFGKEAIDTLVEEMTKHGENLVVVLAGYPNEMDNLLESNPGLKSRFKKFFYFPDYNVDELILIMELYSKKYAYELDSKAVEFIRKELMLHPVKGNGRYAENIIHEAIQQQALRLIEENDTIDEMNVNVLTVKDIEAAYHLLKKGE